MPAGWQDAALEAEFFRLAHARKGSRDRAQLAAQTDLTQQDSIGRHASLSEAGGHRDGDAKIHRWLVEREAARDIYIDILICQRQPDTLGQHRQQHE